jgi:hypothetical protein
MKYALKFSIKTMRMKGNQWVDYFRVSLGIVPLIDTLPLHAAIADEINHCEHQSKKFGPLA